MLPSATKDLTRRNPEIPGLALVLDPDAFLAALRRAIPRSDLAEARILSVRLEPHIDCRVTYRLAVAGNAVELDARACRPEDLGAWTREAEVASEPGPLGVASVALPEHFVVVLAFPNDSKLPALRDLMDGKRRETLLDELLPGREDFRSGELRSLRYRPGRRYVAELRAADGSRVLLKVSTARGHARSKRSATAFRSAGVLRVARLLGASDPHRVLAFEWLPGTVLFDLCAGPRMNREAVATAGSALAALHAQSPDGLERWKHEAEVADLLSVAAEIGFLCPWLDRRAGELAQRLAARLAGEPALQTALHGDFSTRHVLVHGRAAGIVDLDWACRGDPADDLGSILAQVERHALCGELPADRVGRFREALLGGYSLSRRGSLPERIGLYTAVELLRGARFPFRRYEPDWPERTGLLLQRAEEVSQAERDAKYGASKVETSRRGDASA